MARKKKEETEVVIDIPALYFRFIEKGNVAGLKKLIEENNIDINLVKTPAGNTGLMYAVHFKKKEVIKYLMQAGADVNIKNNNNESAADIGKNNKELKELLEKRRLFY